MLKSVWTLWACFAIVFAGCGGSMQAVSITSDPAAIESYESLIAEEEQQAAEEVAATAP